MSEGPTMNRLKSTGYPGNALNEYELYLKEPYKATADEWEDWAKRIVKSFNAELRASKHSQERIAQLEAQLAAHLENEGDECPLCACEAQVEALKDYAIRLLLKLEGWQVVEAEDAVDALLKEVS